MPAAPLDPAKATTSDACPHCSHWGAFRAFARDGRVERVEPFGPDPAPSPLLAGVAEAVHSAVRIAAPMVRRGWLSGRCRTGRGAEPFVQVGWDEALGLVAGELTRLRNRYGNEAIFGGSYGWASAGRFHHAKTQLQRFLNCFGGYTGQVHTYSIAAGLALLPHVVGGDRACRGPLTSWDSIAAHTDLLVCFGGLSAKNTQVEAGGIGEHRCREWLERAVSRGMRIVNVSPLEEDVDPELGAEWIPIRPGSDTALMLGIAHTLRTRGCTTAPSSIGARSATSASSATSSAPTTASRRTHAGRAASRGCRSPASGASPRRCRAPAPCSPRAGRCSGPSTASSRSG